MKRLIIILTIMSLGIKTYSQVFKHNFLGEDFLLYKGVLLKLDPEATSGFGKTFYKDFKYCKSLYNDNVIYPNSKYNFNTERDSLLNRVFVVENIVDYEGINWNETAMPYFENPIIVLKDTLTNQIIYYKYDKEYDFNFPFLTSKIVNYEEIICSRIERRIDDFTGKIEINSPITGNGHSPSTIIYKNIKSGKVVYYLSLQTYGNTLNINKTGVIILFTDGTKWSRQSRIDVEAEKDGFQYSAFITLTSDDLILLSSKRIKKFRLYIYDEAVNSAVAERFRLFVKCIKKTK